jgi:hypothetical protein
MSGAGFHVHGPHDHELEHAAQHGAHGDMFAGMINQIADVHRDRRHRAAPSSAYMGGATQANAGLYKNNAAIKKTEASNQWNYFQSKSTKQSLAEVSRDLTVADAEKARYQAKIDRYEKEKAEIKAVAREAGGRSHRLGQAQSTSRCTSTTAGPRPPPCCRCPSRWPRSHC